MAVPGTLKILIQGAKDLASIVSVGEQYPYYLLECGQYKSKSKPCQTNGRNPEWSVAHKFQLTSEMVVKVIIKDDLTKGIIGEALIDLERVRRCGKDDSAAPLTTLGGQQRGLLQFRLKFSADSGAAPPTHQGSRPEPIEVNDELASVEGGGHPYAAVLSPSGGGAIDTYEVASEYDDTLRSVNTKAAMAKAAMAQLNAELAELTGVPVQQQPPVLPSAGDRSRRTSHSQQQQQPQQHSPVYHHQQQQQQAGYPGPGSSSSSARGRRVTDHSQSGEPFQQQQQQQQFLQPPQQLQQQQPRAKQAGLDYSVSPMSSTSLASTTRRERLAPDQLLQLYARGGSNDSNVPSRNGQMQELMAALEAAHEEKVALEEELTLVKREMANMTSQHYHEIQRIKTAANSSAGTPRGSPMGGATNGMFSMVKQSPGKQGKAGAAQRAAGGAALKVATGGATVAALSSPRGLEDPADEDDWEDASSMAGAGEKGGSPLAAHRLEVKVLQLERQLAQAAAQAAEQEARTAKQAEEMAELRVELETAKAAARQLEQSNKVASSAAAVAATTTTEAKQQAAEAAKALQDAAAREAALQAELSSARAAASAAAAEKTELEEALGLMERNNMAEVTRLQEALTKARSEVELARKGSEDVASLHARLAAAAQEADGLKSTAEEVEYLQEQLRRKTRTVVELQHKLQLLESQHTPAHSAAEGAKGKQAAADEVELLMQELVGTKLELAELKEAQVVTQRQLYQAQLAVKQGGAGISTGSNITSS